MDTQTGVMRIEKYKSSEAATVEQVMLLGGETGRLPFVCAAIKVRVGHIRTYLSFELSIVFIAFQSWLLIVYSFLFTSMLCSLNSSYLHVLVQFFLHNL